MPIKQLNISGYRSVRDLSLRLGGINVLVGPNGCGKTNIYRALSWLSAAAQGTLARCVVAEGGMPSALWAGPRTKGPVRLSIRVKIDSFSYELSCGLPQVVGKTQFLLDPEVKQEHVYFHEKGRKTTLLERSAGTVRARDDDGAWAVFPLALSPSESALSELREPHRFPVLSMLRQQILDWRFYHQFRTDQDSPLRRPHAGCRTPVLDHEGRHLAAALQTILEIGDRPALSRAVDHAFPGATLKIEGPASDQSQPHLTLGLQDPDFQRPFQVAELSDGTLQYLCLVAALLSPRPPSLIALNEPETSIHPDLIEPLAHLIIKAAEKSQVWVTTHSTALAAYIQQVSGTKPIALQKFRGETKVQSAEDEPSPDS
jgi:predicted ATPase